MSAPSETPQDALPAANSESKETHAPTDASSTPETGHMSSEPAGHEVVETGPVPSGTAEAKNTLVTEESGPAPSSAAAPTVLKTDLALSETVATKDTLVAKESSPAPIETAEAKSTSIIDESGLSPNGAAAPTVLETDLAPNETAAVKNNPVADESSPVASGSPSPKNTPATGEMSPEPTVVDEMERRREFVKTMVKKAWKGANSALSDNSILSIKRSSSSLIKFRSLVSQDSLMNAMTSFAVMGMEAEFNYGAQWVETQLEFDKLDKDLDVSRVIINYIGGLLSCFALTWNRIFLDKAEQMALKLEPAYKTATGLPFHSINPVTGQATGSLVWLSELTTGRLEYAYLSDITDNPQYKRRFEVAQKFLASKERPLGLYPWKVDVDSGDWANTTATCSFPSRRFFQNLVKGHLYSNKKDVPSLQTYAEAVEAMQLNKMLVFSRTGLQYARDYDYSTQVYDSFMSRCSGYLGALFGLGATALQAHKTVPQELVEQHWTLATNFTETCYEAAQRTATKLIPARFYFNGLNDATNSGGFDREFSLSPEVAESYFVMWRLTKEPKYREYAWKLVQAIEQHCKDKNGYWDLLDVEEVPTKKAPFHDPHLISGTLKYLYLTFCEDHVLPLDMWVFNSAGNPLPIGAHEKGLQHD